MLGFPVEVLNGQLAAGDIVTGFLVGGAWLALARRRRRAALAAGAAPLQPPWEGEKMYVARLIGQFIRVSFLEETAYRANFLALLNSLLGCSGVAGVAVVYGQAEVGGWDHSGALVVLGVYLAAQALQSLFIGPGLDSLAGMDGDLWTGRLDFTLLRPLNTQFMVSVRRWRPFALVDLALGRGCWVRAVTAGARR